MTPRRLLIVTLQAGLLLGMPACSAFSTDAPPVPDSTLVDVLVELHLAEGRAEITGTPVPAARDSILARYGVTPDAFDETVAYYADRPEAYLEVYDAVLDALSAERLAAP